MPDGCSCHLLRTTEVLESFRPQWDALWSEDGNATPFQSAAWLLPWWHHFGQADLRAVVVSRHGKPVALLPFYVCREPVQGERKLLLLGAGTSDYLDGLFAPDCTTEHVKMALDCILCIGGWDRLYAVQLRETSPLYKALGSMSATGGQSFGTEKCLRVRAVPMDGLPGSLRRNARYYRNRAEQSGKLTIEFADARGWKSTFDALVELHTQRWQRTGEPGVFADHRVLAFHHEAIPLLLQKKVLSLCSLCFNGEAIATAYWLADPSGRQESARYAYLIGYSLTHAELGPGTLLLASMTEHAANDGVAWIDMLRGEENYKKLWHPEPVPTFGFAFAR
jgi:CelD/BcsL family acetyltransferase involved in cellulose biosynthesis